jgi:uncharacterized protein (PEP-CTERM system associated)
MGMAVVRGGYLGKIQPYNVSKWYFGLLCAFGFAPAVTAGEHFWIDTRSEARLTLTDNALLTLNNRVKDVVLNVSPGLNVRWESKRVTAGVDYAVDYFYFFSDKTTDVRQSGFATLDAEVIEDHLSINGRASLREKFLNQRGSISNSFSNRTDNRRLMENYTGSAVLKGGLRNIADWRVSYRYGLSRSPADNLLDETLTTNFSDSNSQEIRASIDSGSRYNNFTWRLSADSSRVTRNLNVNDFRKENMAADLTFKFNRFIQAIGGINYSSNGFQSAVLSAQGMGWEGGLRLTPGRKLDVTVLAGQKGLRKTWYVNLQYLFTTRWALTGGYEDVLSANAIVTNNSLQDFGFDQDLGISNSAGLPIDETDPIFTFSDVDFRRRTAKARITLRQKRTDMYLAGNYELRTFDDGTGTAKSWGVNYGFRRKITKRSSLKGRIGFRQSRFEGEARTDNYIEANLDWTATLSRYFKAAVQLGHSERQSTEPGADLEENTLTFYIRGTY